MAQFLDTTAVSHELTQLIKKADEKLYLLSPYLQIAPPLKDLIKERDSRKIDIRFVYGKVDKLNQEDMSFLQELTSVKISFCENMHAKCYLNENTAIVTSMNLYQYSQQNNREMGIKIEKDKDPDLFKETLAETIRLIQTAVEPQYIVKKKTAEPVKTPQQKAPQQKQTLGKSGFCIRCHATMDINPEKPLCAKCYPIWAKFSDKTYEEKYCHLCGKESKQSYEKPVCYNCYKKFYK
jgi:phosphatidylserine/phosphatidylglycerophosphate/cardiolipin synthase-like enzyme